MNTEPFVLKKRSITALCLLSAGLLSADAATTWNGSTSGSWATLANWTSTLPAGDLLTYGAGTGVGIAAVLYLLFASRGSSALGTYLTEDAVIGKLTVTTSASGTLAPTRSVDVGSELSGTIEAVLVECAGDRAEAARRLGISRTTLWRKLKGP